MSNAPRQSVVDKLAEINVTLSVLMDEVIQLRRNERDPLYQIVFQFFMNSDRALALVAAVVEAEQMRRREP